ncbi:hypothetical protein M3O96_07945 [Aquiflexum sp. TKW24L]|uniref:hypothetical protein n=1 Tax=Aquiflexum sp. TKW24L TaxID=2942212 RepID=UPI0020BDDDD5|nr:hypothetical protein [Aquiflexum sp. TKW24L]MCL6259013.1 hypothetical protein [Aquiflexum sp. TKW24L]
MKKLLMINWALLAVMGFLAISGCGSKDGDDDMNPDDTNKSGYFLKAKVDGKLVEFKTETLLSAEIGSLEIGLDIPTVYNLSLSGSRQVSNQSALEEVITIILTETTPITEKTYTGLVPFETGFKGVLLGYALEVEEKSFITDVTDPNVNLQITEIKPTFVKGKFSGVVIEFLSGGTKTITEGEFFLPRRN